jgi:TetR/AcrR family transcriptional regulator, tetracycline repressor protein
MVSGHPREARLSRRRAAVAALELIGREGLEAFSMRALGRELGVDPMAIYHHVPGKEALFDAVVEVVWGEVELPPPAGEWATELRALARAVREVLGRHANALPIIATRSSGMAGLRVLDHGIAVLRRAGVPAREGFVVLNVASSFLMGHALAEVGSPPGGVRDASATEVGELLRARETREALPSLAAALAAGDGEPSWDESFEVGLDTLVRGVEVGLSGGGPGVVRPG